MRSLSGGQTKITNNNSNNDNNDLCARILLHTAQGHKYIRFILTPKMLIPEVIFFKPLKYIAKKVLSLT